MLTTCLYQFDALQTQLYSSLPTGHWRTNNQKSQQSLCGEQWWYPAEWLRNYFNHTDILRLQKSLATIVMDTELAQPVTPPPLFPSLPPSFSHATQVAGGLGLSLTAANYRLTRPRCALHDCLAPRSGYPERDGEKGGLAGQRETEEQREEGGGRKRR